MAIMSFLVGLAGATMLLLFAVRMVRTGIERSFGASFQRVLTQNTNLVRSSLTGMVLAMVLQSSAAVALLASGFLASGYLTFSSGLAVVLGGDLGSALVIQILSFKMDWLIPMLLAIGGWLFVTTEHKKGRQLGRILMGVAFILISLQFLRDAMDPVRESSFLPATADYLAGDFITAFIIGAALAFVLHSSLAAILMCVTLVQIGAIPFPAALSLLLGANLGSAFIPIWLTRGMTVEARRIPVANLMLRGSWALVALLGINLAIDPTVLMLASPGQSLVYAHIGFNLSLLVVALPFSRSFEAPISLLMPVKLGTDLNMSEQEMTSALDPAALSNPKQSIASLKRELLRMTDLVDRMLRTALQLYESDDREQMLAMRSQDEFVNSALSGIRSYVASMPAGTYAKQDMKIVRGLMDYAIRLEAAGDIIAKKLTAIAKERQEKKRAFPARDGWNWCTCMRLFAPISNWLAMY